MPSPAKDTATPADSAPADGAPTRPATRFARRALARKEGVGLMEWIARLALVPVLAAAAWGTWSHGWLGALSAWALAGWLALLAVRWRRAVPPWRRHADPGDWLRGLSKLAMTASVVVVPVGLAQGEWLVASGFVVLALASAGLWLRWRWAFWAWCAYSVAGLADWAIDAARLALSALEGGAAQPSEWRPLLEGLPAALFAMAVLGSVIEWRRRAFGTGDAPDSRDRPDA